MRCCFLENEFIKGEWAGEYLYAILAAEWAARPRAVQPPARTNSSRAGS
jgi:hypothetical protein